MQRLPETGQAADALFAFLRFKVPLEEQGLRGTINTHNPLEVDHIKIRGQA
jgi:hypothetical protein